MGNSPITRAVRGWKWSVLALFGLSAVCMPRAFGQVKGCEGVNFAQGPPSQYSPAKLKERLAKKPRDVDALIHQGIRLEEQDQLLFAEKLYVRAIQAKPDCYLGYLFAGLVQDRTSGKASAEAEENIHMALSLNPRLRDDGNVQSFMARHPGHWGGPIQKEDTSPSDRTILGAANLFGLGAGCGVLLAVLIFYLARKRGRSINSPL